MSAATPAYRPSVRARSSFREVLAVLMLTFGSLLIGIGWLVGVALLWTSDRWRVSEKVLGTLVWPFGYAGVLFLGSVPVRSCSSVDGGPEICSGGALASPVALVGLAVVLLGAPLVVGGFLLVRAHARALGELDEQAASARL
jgi:hypothetical protein